MVVIIYPIACCAFDIINRPGPLFLRTLEMPAALMGMQNQGKFRHDVNLYKSH